MVVEVAGMLLADPEVTLRDFANTLLQRLGMPTASGIWLE